MSKSEYLNSNYLSRNPSVDMEKFLDTPLRDREITASGQTTVKPKLLGYIFEPDKIALSYSRLQTLKTCPRKFLLKELNHRQVEFLPSIDTAYGSALGAGIQSLFLHANFPKACISALENWDYDDLEAPTYRKSSKDFASLILTLEAFYNNSFQDLYSQYQLAYIEGKPGVELFVYMNIHSNYNYQIHVDLVLQDRETKELLVTEIKTSTYPGDIADWKNSEQTLGYYTFLKYLADKYGYPIAPKILYIVSQAGKYLDYEDDFGFNFFWIPQSEETVLEFNANLIVDILTIELYIDHGHFPKRGSSCKTFGRVCEFFDLCDLEKFTHTEAPLESGGYKSLTLDDADFQIDLSKLIARSSDS